MAVTKTTVGAWNANVLTANAANETSDAVNVADAYHAMVCMSMLNGATGPTVAGQIRVEIGVDETNDANASNFSWYRFAGGFSAGNANNGGASWTVEIPMSAEWVRFVAGENKDQDVTVDAWVVKTTSLN